MPDDVDQHRSVPCSYTSLDHCRLRRCRTTIFQTGRDRPADQHTTQQSVLQTDLCSAANCVQVYHVYGQFLYLTNRSTVQARIAGSNVGSKTSINETYCSEYRLFIVFVHLICLYICLKTGIQTF